MKKILSLLLAAALCAAMVPAVYAAPAEGEFDAALRLEEVDWTKSTDGAYYSAKVEYCTNVVEENYQYMNVYVPAAYLEGGTMNGYTADTAPMILLNNCMGWNSSAPGMADMNSINAGFVFIACGARSRDLGANGKAPTPVVDLKSAVRALRLNDDVIPGDAERIVSTGTSGGGQMSSILGASGNMEEYYSYLYENGAAGISKQADGTYVSTIGDDIFAAMCFCPIADLAHGDQAYAWMRYGAGDTGYVGMFTPGADFDALQFELADRLAFSYAEYLDSLGIVNEAGEVLAADAPGSGSYYEQTLANISESFNLFMEKQTFPYSVTIGFGPTASTTTYETVEDYLATYKNVEEWLVKDADGTYRVTDLAGFIKGTSLIRNKDIPGYDTLLRTEENNAFGKPEQTAVHYSAGVAAVMEEMLEDDTLTALVDGAYYGDTSLTYRDIFNAYIEEANDPHVVEQVYLMNATQILLDTANGTQDADFAPHWRTRNGTADEHTSFSTAYNLAMAAKMAGADVDYSLVWGMVHGEAEGTTTGTFVNWVHSLCGGTPAPEVPGAAPGGAPPSGSFPGEPPTGEPPAAGIPGDTSFAAYQEYLLTTAAQIELWQDGFFQNMVTPEVKGMTEDDYESHMMYTILVSDSGFLSYEAWVAAGGTNAAVTAPEVAAPGEPPTGEPPAGEPPTGEPPAEETPEEPPVEETPAEPPVEEPPAEEPPAAPAQPEPEPERYTVAANDTLWGIAQKLLGTGFKWNLIFEANRDIIKDANLIFIGQKLIIPAP